MEYSLIFKFFRTSLIERVENQGDNHKYYDTEDYFADISEGVEDKNTTDRKDRKPAIQVPQRSSIFRVMTSEVRAQYAYKDMHEGDYGDSDKKKFKDKMDTKEMVRVRTIKRFFG